MDDRLYSRARDGASRVRPVMLTIQPVLRPLPGLGELGGRGTDPVVVGCAGGSPSGVSCP